MVWSRFPAILVVWSLAVSSTAAIALSQEMFVLPCPDGYLSHHTGAMHWAFSPDGRLLATTAVSDPRRRAADGRQQSTRSAIIVWDVASRKVVATLRDDATVLPTCLAFSPDSQSLLSASHQVPRGPGGVKLRVWNVKNWKPLELLAASESLDPQVTQMAFSPDGSLLAVLCQWERNVKILHTRDGRERAVLETGGYARSLRFSPDGRTLAIALETLAHYGRRGPNKSFGEVQFWDLGSFKRQKRIQGFATWDLERGLQVDSRWINLGHEMTLSPKCDASGDELFGQDPALECGHPKWGPCGCSRDVGLYAGVLAEWPHLGNHDGGAGDSERNGRHSSLGHGHGMPRRHPEASSWALG